MPPSPTTPPTPESQSSPTFISPVTAPGLRMRKRQPAEETPTPSPTESPEATAPPLPPPPDPIDAGGSNTSGDKPTVKAGASPWRNLARGLVAAGSALVHERVASTDQEVREQTWITTAAEQAQIGDPIAAMAERRGLPAGENPDINDLITLGLGVAAYLAKNIARTVMARLAARRAAKHAAVVEPPEQYGPWGNGPAAA